MFIKPCEGRITSYYGKDTLNGQVREHYGIDIAKSGMVPIRAVADGVVSKSYTSSSYGEVIFIKHVIDGQSWETVYAHMREGSRGYLSGQNVKQGTIIGYMGNTGYSTGQHLHFELHKGSWNYQKSMSVDPLKYLQDASYIGKRLECIVPKLRFYSAPSWSDKYVAGHLEKGYGFNQIINKTYVQGYPQYKVMNSKGDVYYVTANSKYVRVE